MEHRSTYYDLIATVLILVLVSLYISPAIAGELVLKPSVTSSVSVFNREFEDSTQTSNTLTLAPSLNTTYKGSHSSLSMLLTQSVILRDDETNSSGDNYTDAKLVSQIALIKNLLSLELSADQSYRARSQSQFDVSNRISAPNDLTKVQSSKALLSFTLPNSPYIGLNWQASISRRKSGRVDGDTTLTDGNRVNGGNVLLAANVFQGKKVQNYTYNFSARLNETNRANFQDFKSTNLNGNIGIGLSDNFALIAQGRFDDYGSETLSFSTSRRNIDTESYGAGIRWQPREARTIELTYNQLEQNENTSRFVGVNTQWAFSKRTSMKLDYGKRFYGDAYTFDFNYKSKSLRASIGYKEDVTSFARLDPTTQDVGIFVCTFGSSDLEDCFQPDDLDYVLQPGEEYRSSTEISSDIAEDVIFRKTGKVSISYQKRKLKASLNLSRGSTEYLESDIARTRTSASINLNYKLSRRANVNLTTSLAQNILGNEDNKTETFQSTLAFNRSFKQNLQASLSLRYAKRDRNTSDISLDFVDTMLSASLVYQF